MSKDYYTIKIKKLTIDRLINFIKSVSKFLIEVCIIIIPILFFGWYGNMWGEVEALRFIAYLIMSASWVIYRLEKCSQSGGNGK